MGALLLTAGSATEILIRTKEFLKIKKRMNELLSKHTGKPLEVIEKETDRDNFMGAREAMEFGLVDQILERMPLLPPRQPVVR